MQPNDNSLQPNSTQGSTPPVSAPEAVSPPQPAQVVGSQESTAIPPQTDPTQGFQPQVFGPGQVQPINPTASQVQPASSQLPPRHRNRLLKYAIISLVVCLVVVGGVFTVLKLKPLSPDQAFKSALVNALSTKSLTQQTTAKESSVESKEIVKYDLTNVKNPLVDAKVQLSADSAKVDFEGYGTLKDTYVKINELRGTESIPSTLKGKWIQINKNGITPNNSDTFNTMSYFYDPNYVVLGQYIYGNFSTTERKTLEDYALQKHLYDYTSSDVKKAKLNGTDVYVYKVRIDGTKLKDYNRMAAALFGINDLALNYSLGLVTDTSAEMYISAKGGQLIQVKTSSGVTTTYSDWNITELPSSPKGAIPYDKYLDQLNSANLQDPGNTQTKLFK
ncbi:MAG: DUF1720 domain-containing protein [Candidatus Saccharimonadales bacterium]